MRHGRAKQGVCNSHKCYENNDVVPSVGLDHKKSDIDTTEDKRCRDGNQEGVKVGDDVAFRSAVARRRDVRCSRHTRRQFRVRLSASGMSCNVSR